MRQNSWRVSAPRARSARARLARACSSRAAIFHRLVLQPMQARNAELQERVARQAPAAQEQRPCEHPGQGGGGVRLPAQGPSSTTDWLAKLYAIGAATGVQLQVRELPARSRPRAASSATRSCCRSPAATRRSASSSSARSPRSRCCRSTRSRSSARTRNDGAVQRRAAPDAPHGEIMKLAFLQARHSEAPGRRDRGGAARRGEPRDRTREAGPRGGRVKLRTNPEHGGRARNRPRQAQARQRRPMRRRRTIPSRRAASLPRRARGRAPPRLRHRKPRRLCRSATSAGSARTARPRCTSCAGRS